MGCFREDYMWYYCEATCIVPFDHYRKGDIIEYTYTKPVQVYESEDDAFRMGLAQFLRIPYEDAEKARKALHGK